MRAVPVLLVGVISIVGTCGAAISQVGQANQTLSNTGSDVMVIDEAKPFVAPNNQLQRLTESIDLQRGQDKLDLTLTYENGTATAPGFKWLRIASPSMHYVTEADFGGRKTLSLDVSGELGWGGNQLLITAEGVPGATFNWKLTTPKPRVTSVYPQQLMPGHAVTISGVNFCPDPTGNSVTIGGKAAQINSATANKLIVTVPEEIPSGNINLSVQVANTAAGELTASVNAFPWLRGVSQSFCPPGQQFTIYGENFSPAATDNVVYVGSLQAEVVGASQNQITVIAPVDYGGMPWGYYQPIRVTVRGVPARNTISISIAQVG